MKSQVFRHRVRSGDFRGPTAGHCAEYVHANLAFIPERYAEDFAKFCELNPKPCPLLGVSEPGKWELPAIAADLDLRNDAPGYFIYRDGEFAAEVTSLDPFWRDDWVTFAIGCSYSFEYLLLREGIPVRHIEEGRNAPVYVTNVPNRRSGPFGGNLVVSMRPMTAEQAIRAAEITGRYPRVHGAPVHIGDPSHIGIYDLDAVDYGDRVTVREHEIPVFWACGVTPQSAMISARLPIAIGHAPGNMLVTDILLKDLLVS